MLTHASTPEKTRASASVSERSERILNPKVAGSPAPLLATGNPAHAEFSLRGRECGHIPIACRVDGQKGAARLNEGVRTSVAPCASLPSAGKRAQRARRAMLSSSCHDEAVAYWLARGDELRVNLERRAAALERAGLNSNEIERPSRIALRRGRRSSHRRSPCLPSRDCADDPDHLGRMNARWSVRSTRLRSG